jgi:hypothetical protein
MSSSIFVLFSKYYNDQIKDDMGRECSTNGEMKNAYRILDEKPEVNRPLGRPRYKWEDNIKMYLKEIG